MYMYMYCCSASLYIIDVCDDMSIKGGEVVCNSLVSYPGIQGRRNAWYTLLAHVFNFREIVYSPSSCM